MLILASLLTAAITSAVLSDHSVLHRQMFWFVLGSMLTVSAGLVLWAAGAMSRFGSFESARGAVLTNRNAVAAHLAVAAIIALCQAPAWRRWNNPSGLLLSYGPFAILASGVILTGSRGGFLTFLASCTVALFGLGGRKRGWPIFWSVYGAAWSLALLVSVPNPVITRLLAANTLSFGDRTPIWTAATTVVTSGSAELIRGTGLGGSNKALAMAAPDIREIQAGVDGISRVNAHNGYVDWIVSFGVVGAVIAVFTLMFLGWRAITRDMLQGKHMGQALLTAFLFASITGVPYGSAYSIAAGAIFLGYLARPSGAEHRQLKSLRHKRGANIGGSYGARPRSVQPY
jgi:O-antigen ligase